MPNLKKSYQAVDIDIVVKQVQRQTGIKIMINYGSIGK